MTNEKKATINKIIATAIILLNTINFHDEENIPFDSSEEINAIFNELKEEKILDSEKQPHCGFLLKCTDADQMEYVIEFLESLK